MSDRRYSTSAWQRLRKQVLARDGYQCQLQGARCRGIANTVHHRLHSSTHPHLFWDPSNLEASCGPCNYSDGATTGNAHRRERIADLQELVLQQQYELEQLRKRLAQYENPATPVVAKNRPKPAIY
jgi:5-methylcytosine-specific restriction endonuclease McrA